MSLSDLKETRILSGYYSHQLLIRYIYEIYYDVCNMGNEYVEFATCKERIRES